MGGRQGLRTLGVRSWGMVWLGVAAWMLPMSGRGDLIAYWHFNDSNLVVDQGAGTLTVGFPAGDSLYQAGSTRNAVTGTAAGQALTVRGSANNNSGYVHFAVDTSGYSGLMLSLASQKTSTGFNSNQLSYSADGGATFTNFGTAYNPATSFETLAFDLSGVSELNNNPAAQFRILFAGATSATGNNRIDNVQFQGTAGGPASVPEPSVWLLASAAAVVAAGRRLRRLRSLSCSL